LRYYVGTDAQLSADTFWDAYERAQPVNSRGSSDKSSDNGSFEGVATTTPETHSALENKEQKQTRPGVIRTHDQGIMRTKAFFGMEVLSPRITAGETPPDSACHRARSAWQ